MSSDREVHAVRVVSDAVAPELLSGAARVLLRILRKADGRQRTVRDGGAPDMRVERT